MAEKKDKEKEPSLDELVQQAARKMESVFKQRIEENRETAEKEFEAFANELRQEMAAHNTSVNTTLQKMTQLAATVEDAEKRFMIMALVSAGSTIFLGVMLVAVLLKLG